MANQQIEGLVKGIVLGGIAGAVLAILFAPQSGRKTREDICEKGEELLTKAKKEYDVALKKTGKAYESAVKQMKHLESSAKETAGKMEEKVEELAELGKEAIQDTKSQLSKAASAAAHALK